jgi:hypothetical protein
MDKFSPEFSALWENVASPAPGREAVEAAAKESLSSSQERALQELAERVSAARSVI